MAHQVRGLSESFAAVCAPKGPFFGVGPQVVPQMGPGTGRVRAEGALVLPVGSIAMPASEVSAQVFLRRETVTAYVAGDEHI